MSAMTAAAQQEPLVMPMDSPIVDGDTARYFACAELKADPTLPHLLMGEYARGLYEMALELCDAELAQLSPSIHAQRADIVAEPFPWAAAWHPDLAELERLLPWPGANSRNAWAVLAPMLVRLGAEGVIASADIEVAAPRTFFWHNLKLPDADRVAFDRRGNRADIRLFRAGQPTAEIAAERDENGLWQSDDAQSVGIVWLAGHPLLLWTPEDGRGYPHPGKRPPLPNALSIVQPAFAEASELLAKYSPNYIPWIADVMRNIVPLDATDGIRMSASVEEYPGLTFLSFPVPGVELPETLAHESSHHHFLALQRLTPLHDGSDKTDYYSPIKKKSRSIDLILYAYHAFANAAIYHRNLVRQGNPQYFTLNGRTLDESLERIRVMDGYLAATPALTPAGKTLWQPLSDALFKG